MDSTTEKLLTHISAQLSPVSGDLAWRDAERILTHLFRVSLTELYTNPHISEKKLSNMNINKKINKLVKKRLTGIPLPYVLGYEYFYSKHFHVSKDVLIPRPDTETLIETILSAETTENAYFIDFGTGSGIIAETLLKEKSGWDAIAIDISIQALKTASKNCIKRINLICSDKFFSIKEKERFDFIASNPPYISQEEMAFLDHSVLDFEPSIALYGGKDGLDFFRYLANSGKSYLKKNGRIYCEIGFKQEKSVRSIFQKADWNVILTHKDIAGRPRVITARKL